MLKVIALMLLLAVSLISSASITTKSNTDDQTQGSSMDNDKSISKDLMTMGSDQANMAESEDPPVVVDLMAIMNECNETYRIEIGYLTTLNESGSFPDETVKTPKCFVRCVLEKTGVVSLEGEFDASKTAEVFAGQRGGKTMDGLQDVATTCAAERTETCKCERSYRFMKCLVETEITKYEQM